MLLSKLGEGLLPWTQFSAISRPRHENLFFLLLAEAFYLTHVQVDVHDTDSCDSSEDEEGPLGRPVHQRFSSEALDRLPKVKGEDAGREGCVGANFCREGPGTGP